MFTATTDVEFNTSQREKRRKEENKETGSVRRHEGRQRENKGKSSSGEKKVSKSCLVYK